MLTPPQAKGDSDGKANLPFGAGAQGKERDFLSDLFSGLLASIFFF